MVDLGVLISFLIFVCILLLGVGLYLFTEHRKERSRLMRKIQQAEDEIYPVKGSFLEETKRQWVRFVTSLGHLVRPKREKEISHLRKALFTAGYRREDVPLIFWGFKVLLAILFGVFFVSIRLLVARPIPSFNLTLLTVIIALIGFYLPNLWLRMKMAARKDQIQKGLPDALDLMVVCVQAGSGLDAAINRVTEEMILASRPLSEEFKVLSLELRAGKSRQEALRNLALRTDLEDVRSLVTLLIQSERFGTSIANALRVHSDSMRTKRFQKAEEVAAKLPVKLIFPLILFIFPSLFIVILGPAAISIFRMLLPRLAGQ